MARTLELLRGVDAPVIGTVLNGVTDEGAYGYGDQYYVYYRPSPPVGRRSNQPRNSSMPDRRLGAHAVAD
jgi:Mrp family chromosome partitioning ATPase